MAYHEKDMENMKSLAPKEEFNTINQKLVKSPHSFLNRYEETIANSEYKPPPNSKFLLFLVILVMNAKQYYSTLNSERQMVGNQKAKDAIDPRSFKNLRNISSL